MPIVIARIDDRLVHGQVVEGWLRVINANCIVVVNDSVAGDEMQRALYSISVPSDIRIECLTVDDAVKNFTRGVFDKFNALVLFSRPADVLKFIKGGVKLVSVNVGGLHFSPGKKQISKGFSVDDNDVAVLREIANMGVELEARVLPREEHVKVLDLIEKHYK